MTVEVVEAALPPIDLDDGARKKIAAVINVPAEKVGALMTAALNDDMAALDTLWRAVYLQAVSTGLADDQALAKAFLTWRTEVAERLRGQVPPEPVKTQETPGQTVRRAAGHIASSTVVAAATLEKIARYGRSESARVAAARALLDRAGLAGAERVEISWANDAPDPVGTDHGSQLAVIMARLKKIHDAKYG